MTRTRRQDRDRERKSSSRRLEAVVSAGDGSIIVFSGRRSAEAHRSAGPTDDPGGDVATKGALAAADVDRRAEEDEDKDEDADPVPENTAASPPPVTKRSR